MATRFRPFIGSNYINSNTKILALGESHYLGENDLFSYHNNDPAIENITIDILGEFLNYKLGKTPHKKWMNTFSKFGNIIAGKKLSSSDSIAFWDKCAFYNFVQYPTTGSRISPKEHEFQDSLISFLNVSKELSPNVIIIWGYRLWRQLPKEKLHEIEIVDGKEKHYYNSIPIKVIPHPSTSQFNYGLCKGLADLLSE